MLCYGVEETYFIDMHEVTADGDLLLLIKDGFWSIFYLNSIHMLYLALHCIEF